MKEVVLHRMPPNRRLLRTWWGREAAWASVRYVMTLAPACTGGQDSITYLVKCFFLAALSF